MLENRRIRVLVVDDCLAIREWIRTQLEACAQIEIAGEATSGEEALVKAREQVPEVVLMDIGLPGMNGLEAARRLRQEQPGIKVVFLTIYDDQEFIQQALRSGARGYLLKNPVSLDLVQALKAVEQGELVFSEEVAPKSA